MLVPIKYLITVRDLFAYDPSGQYLPIINYTVADIKLTVPFQFGLEIDGFGFREAEIIYDLIGGGGICFMWLLLAGLLLK